MSEGDDGKVERIREKLYLPDNLISLNAGSWGPLCRAARRAIEEAYRDEAASRGDDPDAMRAAGSGLARYSRVIDEAKGVLSGFLGCAPGEVALCDSSTTAMNIFLWGFEFHRGDEVIAGSLENPAAFVPLRVLAERRGVRLIVAEQGNGEVDAVEAVSKAMTPRTRMILMSDVNYATGARVNLRVMSEVAHERDVLILADGIQAVGTVPVNVKELGVDGYALSRHKFLCGPDGAGVLYVDRDVIPRVKPTYSGVFTDSGHGMGGELALWGTAQRYEVSTRPLPVISGGTAAVRWLTEEVGWSYIFERNRGLYWDLWGRLDEVKGVELISGREQNSLMTFAVEGVPPSEVVAKLRESYIFGRAIGVTEPEGVRLSVGFWNRWSDLEIIVEALESIAEDGG